MFRDLVREVPAPIIALWLVGTAMSLTVTGLIIACLVKFLTD